MKEVWVSFCDSCDGFELLSLHKSERGAKNSVKRNKAKVKRKHRKQMKFERKNMKKILWNREEDWNEFHTWFIKKAKIEE